MFRGQWLIFGVILLPVYITLLGWLLGKPRNLRPVLMGFGYLVGLTVLLWGGLAVLAELIGVVFF